VPVTEWGPVAGLERNVWVATSSSTETFVQAARAPNATGVSSAASKAVGARFFGLPPARVVDTRTGLGLSGPFTSGVARSFTLAGHGGAVPWFTGVDARACTGEEAACQAIPGKPDDAALAEIRARLEKAGSAVGLVVGELGPIEIAADGRMFYVEVDLTDDTAAVARIKVKQVRP